MSGEYQFSVARSVDELDALSSEWDELQWPWRMPMLDFAWIRANAVYFYQHGDLHVVVLRRRGQLAAVAPLARKREGRRSLLEFIGASFTRGPCDLLYRNVKDLDALVRRLSYLREPLTIRRLATDLQAEGSAKIRLSLRGIRFSGRPTGMPTLEITGSWENFLSSLSAQRRYDISRARRRLEEQGAVRVTFDHPAPVEVPAVLDRAFAIEASGWKGRSGSAVIDDPSLRAFFGSVSDHYAKRGQLVVAFLECGDAPLAMQIAIEADNRYWILKIGYDEASSRGSPGSLLMTEAVRYAHDRSMTSVEFLGTDEKWLRAWTPVSRRCSSVHFIPCNAHGLGLVGRLLTRRLKGN